MNKIIRLVLVVLILTGFVTGVAQAQIGTTDSFGYSWSDSKSPNPAATYNWLDISATGTNTGINCDDCYSGAPIGFEFTYYGNKYSNVYLGSNGYLTFSGPSRSYSNYQIPSSSTPATMVAPFWDDLYVAYSGRVYYQTIGTAPNRIFIAQWKDVRFCCSDNGLINFQILLYEQSNSIVFQYNSMTDYSGGGRSAGNSATIGIQGSSASQGLQYSFNNANVTPGLSIIFSRLILNVGATFPASNAQDVTLNSTIRASINQQLNPANVTNSSVTVAGSQSGPISGTVNYLPLLASLEFKPSSSFISGETVTAVVNTNIKGVNGAVLQSPYSWSFVVGSVADTIVPPAVTSLSAQDVAHDAGGQIQISWAPNPASDLAYYRVYRNTAPIGSISSLQPLYVTSQNSHKDAATTDGVAYYYAVTAVDTNGNESVASVLGPVVSVNDPPLSPVGLNGNISSNGINLYWNANSDVDFAGYKLYVGTSSGIYGSPVDLGNRTSYELTGVQACSSFHIALTAYDSTGHESPYSGELVINSGSPGSPTAPLGLTATAENGAVNLSWSSNPECDVNSYHVYRSTTSGSGYQYYASVNGTTYRDAAIANGITYYYKVAALDSFSLASPYSNEISVVASDTIPPNQPYYLSGSPNYSGINLQWYGNNYGLRDLSGYKIYYGVSSGNYTAPVQMGTTYGSWNSSTLSGLTNCTDYHIAVSAFDLSGNESQRSTEIIYNSGQAGSPSAPTGLMPVSEESKITINWSLNPECDILDYYVYRSEGNNTNWQYIASVTGNSYVDGRIKHGVTYYYKIVARDRANYTSPYSGEVSAVAINTTAPQAPATFYISAYPGATYLYLSWNGSPEPDISTYKMYYGTSHGNYRQSVISGSTYVYLYGLQACTPYYFALSAVDLSGNESLLSPEQTSFVSGSAAMLAPTGLTISSVESLVTLSWGANPECDVYGYRVYRSTSSGSGYQELGFVPAGTTIYQDRTIANGTTYYYTVRAFNYSSVASSYSVEVSAIAIDTTPPQTPGWVNVAPGDNFIDVNWGASSSADFKQYKLFYGTQSGSYGTPMITSSTSQRLANLNSCATYYITVKSVDQSNLESPAAQEVTARANVPGTPSAPVGLTGEGGNNTATLRWTANSECDVSGYRIFRSTTTGGVSQYIGNASGLTYTDQNLQSETEYFYSVKAVDFSGLISNPSLEVLVITRDTTPPILPVIDPTLSLLTSSSNFTLRGSKEGNSSILINGVVVVPINSNTTWETTVALTGTHNNLSITSKDSAGNECLPVRIDVVRDTQPPQISTSNPASGFLTNQPITLITITLNDLISGVNINQSLVGATVKNQQQAVVAGQWNVLGTDKLVFTPSSPMQEGVYTVSVTLVDTLGNTGPASISFTIDQTPPTIPTITVPSAPVNVATQTVTGTKSTDTVAVLITLNSNQLPQNIISYPSATTWQATVSGFVEGSNTVTAYAKDAAGNQSAGTSATITYDTTSPTVPTVNTFPSVTKDTTIVLTGGKEANSFLYVNGVKTAVLFTDNSWSYTATLREGSNTITVFAKDEAGNQGQSAQVTVVRDTVPPTISASTPTTSAIGGVVGNISITLTGGSATPDLAASTVGAVVKSVAGSVIAGNWSVSDPAIVFIPSAALPDGVYTVTIYPVDTLGNKGSASFSFTIDRGPPTVQTLTVSPVSPLKAGTATFTLTFSESMDTTAQPQVTFGSSNYSISGAWLDAKNWRGSIALTAMLGDGSYNVTVKGGKDLAGNIMIDQIAGTFVLDTTPPSAPTVTAVAPLTKTATQLLTGSKPADTSIVINGTVRVPLSSATSWSYSYPLTEGANTLSIVARDAAGNDSAAIAPSTVITLDTTPPVFTVDVWKTPATAATQLISGKKEPGCIVKMNGVQLFDATDQSTDWSYTLALVDGISNRFVFAATDIVGNSTTKTIDILYDSVPPTAMGVGVLVADGSGKGTEVGLSWPSYPEPTALAYYRVYQANADFTNVSGLTPIGTVSKGTKTYKATGLVKGNSYFFSVVPVSTSGNSDPSVHSVSAIPTDTVAPENVTGLSAVAGYSALDGNTITLTWTASANTSGDLSDQILYVDNGQGYDAGTPIGKTVVTYTKKGLADATLYKFKVTTKDTLNHESAGTVITAVTRLANPSGLTVVPGNAKATLSWQPVASSYVKLYNLYRIKSDAAQSDISGMALIKSQTTTSFIDTGLTNDSVYQYAVTVINTSGAERTGVQSVAVTPRGDTTGPVISGLNLTVNQVISAPFSITATASDTESALDRIELYLDTVKVATAAGSTLSYSWNTIETSDGNHTVKIVAYDAPGNKSETAIPVVVSLAAPSAPVITSTFSGAITQKSVTISGTTQAGATVSLRINGVVIGQQVATGTTFTFTTVSLVEGDNYIAAKAANRGGESSFSADLKVTVDTGAPLAPTTLTAKLLAAGAIQFSWQSGSGETPTGFNLYESLTPFASVSDSGVHKTNSAPIAYLLKEQIPADDTLRYYAVTSLDGAGNESPISNIVSIASDRLAPTATVTFIQNSTLITQNSAVGPGQLNVSLTVSETLKEMPFLSLEPQSGSPIVVALQKTDDTRYTATLTIDATSPHGSTVWKFSGKDNAANRGNSQGTGPILDVRGPQATITEPLTLLKSTAGPVAVSITLDEPSTITPVMSLGSAPLTEMTSRDNIHWSGMVDPSGLAEGIARFTMTDSRDRFNNRGINVTSGATIIIYKTTPPAPSVPMGLTAKSFKGGEVRLTWMPVTDARSYNLYRQGSGDANPLKVTTLSGSAATTYSEFATTDGSYAYSISSVGLLDAESAQSAPVSVSTDSTPPPVPGTLMLTMTGNGVKAEWQAGAGEATPFFRLYRSTAPISNITGLSPVATVNVLTGFDPSPDPAKRFYAVTSLDAIGNESFPSSAPEITFPVMPIRNLVVSRVDDGKPSLSWEAGEANLQGFYIYRNGSRVNQIPTISTTFSDGYFTGGTVTFGVSSVNSLGVESPVREANLPELTIGLKEGTVLRRGALENVILTVAQPVTATVALTMDSVTVKIGNLPESTENGPFAIPIGTPLEVSKVAATEANAAPQTAVVVTTVMTPIPGVTVKITRSVLAGVIASGSPLELFNEPLIRGTQGKARIKVTNTGSARMEFVTSTNGGVSAQARVILRDQDGNILAQGSLAQRAGIQVVDSGAYATVRLEPGESFLSDPITFGVPVNAPYKVALEAVIDNTYFHYGQPDQVMAPGLRQAVDGAIADVSYMASAQTNKNVYKQGESVVISGTATSSADASLMANVPVKVGISVKGFDRFATVNTDNAGNFSYTFTPGSSEAGSYNVWAIHPDLADRTIQAQFSIIGLQISPLQATIRLLKGQSYDIPVNLVNLGGSPLTNLSFTTNSSSGITATPVNIGNPGLNAGENRTVTFRVGADQSAPASGYASLDIATTEGLGNRVDASITTISAIPVIATTPSYIDTGLMRGNQRIESLTIRNTGAETLINPRIEGPSLSWLALTVDKNIGDIPAGQSRTIGILIKPADTLAQGIYNDRLVIYADNHIPYTYNVQVTVTSSAVGNVQFSVLNELMKDVANANISLQHQSLPELYYTIKTATDGTASLFDIPEGRYTYNISAPGHKPFSGSLVIIPGITATVPIALEVTLVTVEWTVTPVTITDSYQIKITQTFETNVPTSVIVTEPPLIVLPTLAPGQVYNGEFTITNYGLVSANYSGISFPGSFEGYDLEVLARIPTTIGANQKIIVPYRITRQVTSAAAATNIGDEITGYGGGACSGSSSITISFSQIICPFSLNERTVTRTATHTMSWNTCPVSGGVGGGGTSPIATYGRSPGTGSGQSGGGGLPGGSGASTPLPDPEEKCILPCRPNQPPQCPIS